MSTDLRIEKEVRTIRALLADGSTVAATIFVPWGFDGLQHPHSIVDALSDSGEAVPCRDEEGRFVLLGTEAIAAVAVPREEAHLEGFYLRHPAVVKLVGGHELGGQVLHDVGTGDRLSDAFRRVGRWLPLERPDEMVWVRIDAVVWAREEPEEVTP